MVYLGSVGNNKEKFVVYLDTTDYTTLHYTDANGKAAKVSPRDSALYNQINVALSAQEAAAEENFQAVARWNELAANYNGSVGGHASTVGVEPPGAQPLMQVVDDLGNKSTQAFPAGTFLALATPAPGTDPHGLASATTSPSDNSEALTTLLSVVTRQSKILAAIAAKLGVAL